MKTLLSKPETKEITDHLTESSILEFSPLSMMIKSSEVPQEEVKRASDAQFIVHHNYGSEELESQMRVELVSEDDDTLSFLDLLFEM